MTTILLAGATGMVGTATLGLLLADERVTQVVAPTRRPLEQHAKLFNPIVTIEDLPVDAPWWATNGAICALGTTRAKTPSAAAYRAIDYGFALAIATQVRQSGGACFALTSSMGADARSRFRYTRIKGELEESIERLGFESFTILRPGFLGGQRQEARPMERVVGALFRFASPVLPLSARISPASTVAALLVKAVINGQPGTRIINSAEIARTAQRRRLSAAQPL